MEQLRGCGGRVHKETQSTLGRGQLFIILRREVALGHGGAMGSQFQAGDDDTGAFQIQGL